LLVPYPSADLDAREQAGERRRGDPSPIYASGLRNWLSGVAEVVGKA
jgi:hypothetical protein